MTEHVWKFGDWGRASGTIVRFVSVWDGGMIFVHASGTVNCLRDVEYLPDCTGFGWKPIEPPPGYRLLNSKEEIVVGDKLLTCDHWSMVEGNLPGDTPEENPHIRAFARKLPLIEPPPGYRLLSPKEKVRNWDMALRGEKWVELLGERDVETEQIAGCIYARKIEPPDGCHLLFRGEAKQAGDLLLVNGRWRLADTIDEFRKHSEAELPMARKIEPQYRPFANAAEFAPHFNRVVRWVKDKQSCTRVHTYHESCVWVGGASTGMTYTEAFELLTFEHGEPFGVEDC